MIKTVLVIAPEYPYPSDNGTRLALAGSLALLHTAGWRMVLAITGAGEGSTPPAPPPFPLETHFIRYTNRFVTRAEPAAAGQLQALIDRERPALLWVEYAHFAPLVATLKTHGAPIWFRAINFELLHRLEKSRAVLAEQVQQRSLRPGWLREQVRLLRVAYQWERQMHHLAGRIWYISHREQRLLPRLYGGQAVAGWLPPILERPARDIQPHAPPLHVLYMGSRYDDFQNRAGALYLLRTLVPAVNAAFPGEFHFHLTGKFAQQYLGTAAGAANITLHDYLPDPGTLIQQMDLFCLPVRLGWGLKLKMLEGLAGGLPVIGAWQVFRGIPPQPGIYAACRTPADYVRAFGELRDVTSRRRMGAAGRAACLGWYAAARQAVFAALAEVPPVAIHGQNRV
ncbi:MAG: glycosyltransferase family 4 protein [Anaerolineae bacterium]|jgi:glycosyltransferase involved in cell wall biosynthesis|nr:glycosyltransferase family 4 protein [Anaerolineae bacterium]